jgi:hypothetical protein
VKKSISELLRRVWKGLPVVDLCCVTARIEDRTDIDVERIRRATVRVRYKKKVIVEGPLYIFRDLDDLFIEQRRNGHTIATVDPKHLEVQLLGVPSGVRVTLKDTKGKAIIPGMVRILPAEGRWAA